MATAAAFLPITLLGDLVSLGTALGFTIICFTVIWLRNTHPEIERPFRVPLGGFRVRGVWPGVPPLAGMRLGSALAGPLLSDVVDKIRVGNPTPAMLPGAQGRPGAPPS